MDIRDVCSTGPAIAALLQNMARNQLDFDGLILGRYETRTTSTLHDDREEETSDNLQARITSFRCCASICSFYNAAGQIEGEKLAALVLGQQETVLGWFVSRRAVWPKSSMRDSSVCAHLPSCLARLQPQSASRPLLFGVFTAGEDHDGATLGFQQRLFQQQLPQEQGSGTINAEAPLPALLPVPLRIANLGSAQGARAERGYEPLAPVAGLPLVAGPLQSTQAEKQPSAGASSRNKGPLVMPEKELKRMAVTDVQQQVAGVEAIYNALMSQVDALEAAARAKAVKLDDMLKEIDAIS